MKGDYYTLLGVKRSASAAEITRAFRKKALHAHPDVNHSLQAQREFIHLMQARDALLDPVRRARYDAALAMPFNMQDDYWSPPHSAAPSGRAAETRAYSTRAHAHTDSRRRPRWQGLQGLGEKALTVLIGIGAALGLVAIGMNILVGVIDPHQDLREHGITVVATTVDAYTKTQDDGSCAAYIVTFSDQQHQTHRVDVGCTSSVEHVGQTTTVMYDQRDPTQAVLASDAQPPNWIVLVVIVAIIATFMIIGGLSSGTARSSDEAE